MKTILTVLVLSFFLQFNSGLFTQDLTPEQIFEKYNDAVVVITSFDFEGRKSSQGSGVILNDKGYILTNFHIYAGREKLEIKHKDNVISYSGIVGVNVEKDILVLKIDTGSFPEVKLANKEELKIGQKVFAIGSPLGYENTLSDGLISGFREIGEKNKKNYLQITASISPGSSGGAVLNSKGELIGISTMSAEEGQNLNFAIPVEDILGVISGDFIDKKKLESLTYFYKGQKSFDNGDFKQAIEDYSKYLEANTTDFKAYNYRGLAYVKTKDFKKGITDFTKAISLDPKYSAAYNNRGEAYFKLEEYEKAEKDFSKTIQMEPDNTEAWYSRGLAYSKDEVYDKAISDFTKVIEQDPAFAYSYVNRGFCHYERKNYELAMNDWEKAIRLDPSLDKSLRPYINALNMIDHDR